MSEDSIDARRSKLIMDLQTVRQGYQNCLADVSAEQAHRGSEWSIADLIRHNSGVLFQGNINRVLDEDNPQLGRLTLEMIWNKAAGNCIEEIEGISNLAAKLTGDQLLRKAQRGDQSVTAIDLLESWAKHLSDHLVQLKDEIRPREGLPSI